MSWCNICNTSHTGACPRMTTQPIGTTFSNENFVLNQILAELKQINKKLDKVGEQK